MFENLTWLTGVRHCPSPNFDTRPSNIEIELLVIHSISLPPNQFGGSFIDQLFTNSLDKNANPYFADIVNLKVSAHLLIRRDGEVIQ
ncbi:MAG: 1,6-anhydro-N-acetylmuramyl-L-alanine amidase AmpD, partial [Proteobacteria bacterium]|nr:1,6-anhydro-N-acetylmuramyl-L-alanine amidase AmpD [Pseudomonadota bacterium]